MRRKTLVRCKQRDLYKEMCQMCRHCLEILCALADYIRSEGCSCCCNIEDHDEAISRLGRLLRVKKYSDGSGYDFRGYETKVKP